MACSDVIFRYSFPTHVNAISRPIPEQAWFLSPVISVLLAGVLPFGAVFIELFFILNAIWENQFYYLFGFLFLVFIVLIISCTEIAIVMTYMQFCAEDHQWWWRCFNVSGGCAFYVMAYATFYFFTKLEVRMRKKLRKRWRGVLGEHRSINRPVSPLLFPFDCTFAVALLWDSV